MVNKDEMQISYVQEKRTADAIFVVHRMQRKYSALKKYCILCSREKFSTLRTVRSCVEPGGAFLLV